jgi:hypothetical protein
MVSSITYRGGEAKPAVDAVRRVEQFDTERHYLRQETISQEERSGDGARPSRRQSTAE